MKKLLQVLVIVKTAPIRYFVHLSIHPRSHNVPSHQEVWGFVFYQGKNIKKKLLIHNLVNNKDNEVL